MYLNYHFKDMKFYFGFVCLYIFLNDDKGGERMADFDIPNFNSET